MSTVTIREIKPVPLITGTHELSLFDVVIAMALASRIHGSEEAIRETASRCRDKVRRELRPQVAEMMRHQKIGEWLDNILKALP